MERLRTLLAEVARALGALSPRERLLISLAGVTAFLFVGFLAFSSLSSSTRRVEADIDERLEALQQIGIYAQSYATNEQARKLVESRLGGAPVRLLSYMQELATKHGLTISSMNDRGESTHDQVLEALVELQIAAAPIDKLTNLLNEIEARQQVIRVKKLRVRKNSGDEKALNVTLTVATYSLKQG